MTIEAQIKLLDHLLDPLALCFTPETATRLMDLRADTAAQNRMDELADKQNEGQLTAEEQAEYEAYISVANLLAVLQAKARHYLHARPAA